MLLCKRSGQPSGSHPLSGGMLCLGPPWKGGPSGGFRCLGHVRKDLHHTTPAISASGGGRAPSHAGRTGGRKPHKWPPRERHRGWARGREGVAGRLGQWGGVVTLHSPCPMRITHTHARALHTPQQMDQPYAAVLCCDRSGNRPFLLHRTPACSGSSTCFRTATVFHVANTARTEVQLGARGGGGGTAQEPPCPNRKIDPPALPPGQTCHIHFLWAAPHHRQKPRGGGGGGQLQSVRMRPTPQLSVKTCGGGGGLAAQPGGGAARDPLLPHAYLKGVCVCLGPWVYRGAYAIIAISRLCQEESFKGLKDQRHSTPSTEHGTKILAPLAPWPPHRYLSKLWGLGGRTQGPGPPPPPRGQKHRRTIWSRFPRPTPQGPGQKGLFLPVLFLPALQNPVEPNKMVRDWPPGLQRGGNANYFCLS